MAISKIPYNRLRTETYEIGMIENINAGGSKSVTENISLEGYSPLGIVQISGTGVSNLSLVSFYIRDNTNAYVFYRNDTSSAKSNISVTATILYAKI